MNEVSTMEQVLESLKLSAMTTQRVSEQMGLLVSKVNQHEDKLQRLEDRQNYYENNIRITRSQGKQLKKAVIGRVNDLLKIRFEGGVVAPECIETDRKYRGGFIARCYTDAKRDGVMSECYWETPRGDYDKCMEYIGAWVPQVDGGTEKYKEYLDIRREERNARRG